MTQNTFFNLISLPKFLQSLVDVFALIHLSQKGIIRIVGILTAVVLMVFKKSFLYYSAIMALLLTSGCVSCLPQYTAPPMGPPSACYPAGHDPFVPMDHNPSILNPWDLLSSVSVPLAYGPPR